MYASKDYEAECDLIEAAFARFGDGAVRTILDIGCGTGGHALPLARRGHALTGVDQSPQMLARAAEKAAEAGVELELVEGDMRTVRTGATYDAVIVMFAVMGYQRTNDDVRQALRTVREHLRPGGLVVFDVWHGPGVIASPPGSGERTIDTPDGPLRRIVEGELDVPAHQCTVRYRMVAADGREERETHVMRYFFPLELALHCELADLEMVSLTPFGSLEGEVDRDTWNATIVARAR
jgi:SAM-dependent methyltransferase